MTRTEFLREQTRESKNKIARIAIPANWTTADLDCSLSERKAYGLAMMFDKMPLYIGEQELIVGTRTLLGAVDGNEDGHDVTDYALCAYPSYVNQKDVDYFGFDESFCNRTHMTPDYSILLQQGIDGIINSAKEKISNTDLSVHQRSFLDSVIIAYTGFSNLITRYSRYADELAQKEESDARRQELLKIRDVCANIAHHPASNFYEAVQLMWFGQLATIIESFEFINYGRLDVLFYRYLMDTPIDQAQQLIDCLILKMYDQADLRQSYLQRYAAQLNITIGGVDRDGNDAVNPVSFMILNAIEKTRLPEPLLSVRVNSKNPPEFLKRACELSVQGLNFLSYYNDDLFIDSLNKAGLKIEDARDYGFDLCQDINIPGKDDIFCGSISLMHEFLEYFPTALECNSFHELLNGFKQKIADAIQYRIALFNRTNQAFLEFYSGNELYYFEQLKQQKITSNMAGASLMCPLPFLSALFEGCIESATDITIGGCLLKDKGIWIGTPTETINSLAAIKKVVFDSRKYTLSQVYNACVNDYEGMDGEIMRNLLWNAPKWGNDDDYVDLIGKEILEFSCKEILKYQTVSGGNWLAGIHQPHPVPSGHGLMATPEGRKKGVPTSVTLTPESGTMKNGPLAALKSAAKIDYRVYQWNFCVMLSYYSSTFKRNEGAEVLYKLLKAYFKMGGTQHQPNVASVDDLKAAQNYPEKYKDLTVRLWGVSAHFVDLPKELQDEMISRFS